MRGPSFADASLPNAATMAARACRGTQTAGTSTRCYAAAEKASRHKSKRAPHSSDPPVALLAGIVAQPEPGVPNHNNDHTWLGATVTPSFSPSAATRESVDSALQPTSLLSPHAAVNVSTSCGGAAGSSDLGPEICTVGWSSRVPLWQQSATIVSLTPAKHSRGGGSF
jgi:hypothetical protein